VGGRPYAQDALAKKRELVGSCSYFTFIWIPTCYFCEDRHGWCGCCLPVCTVLGLWHRYRGNIAHTSGCNQATLCKQKADLVGRVDLAGKADLVGKVDLLGKVDLAGRIQLQHVASLQTFGARHEHPWQALESQIEQQNDLVRYGVQPMRFQLPGSFYGLVCPLSGVVNVSLALC
jgi:hypothetical protein